MDTPNELAEPSGPRNWVQIPEDLEQYNWNNTPLPMLDVANTNDVVVTAFTQSRPASRCDWEYRLDVELREAHEPLTFQPTHHGEWIRRGLNTPRLQYPVVKLRNLQLNTGYKWAAREHIRIYREERPAGRGGCVFDQEYVLDQTGWAFHHLPFQFSFRTPRTRTDVYPTVQIDTGSLQSGSASDLTSDDGRHLLIQARLTLPFFRQTTAWTATFSGIPRNVSGLLILYRGGSLLDASQSISILSPSANQWVQMHSRPIVGGVDTYVEIDGLSAPFSNWIDAAGNLKMMVVCTCVALRGNITGADLARLTYFVR
jgi:hypothetical protein